MEASKKLKIVSVIFMVAIFLVVIFTTNVINFSAIPEWLENWDQSVDPNSILGLSGDEWRDSQTVKISTQIFMVVFGIMTIVFIFWACLFLIEIVSMAGYYILSNRFEKINYIFEDLVEGSFISMLVFDDFCLGNKTKNIIIRFASVLGAHLLFFVLAPFLVVMWAIKWISGGLFYLLKWVV